MNAFLDDNDRIWRLADAICTDTATNEELRELEARVLADDTARDLYIAYCQLDAALELELGGQRVGALVCGKIRDEIAGKTSVVSPHVCNTPFPFFGAAIHATSDFFSHEAMLGFLTATLLTGLLLLGMWLTPVSKSPTPQIANSQPNASGDAQTPAIAQKTKPDAKPEIQYVGRITGEIDCRWTLVNGKQQASGSAKQQAVLNHKSKIINHKSSVALGDQFSVASGLLEITFDAGAKVILEGPCRFNAETNGGFLAVGRLTGRMEKSGEGRGVRDEGRKVASGTLTTSHQPLTTAFVIATPTALVTDLGTEFGVEVNRQGDTFSHVFRGLVKVSGVGERHELLLAANDSASVKTLDVAANRRQVVVRREPTDSAMTAAFVRSLPSRQAAQDSEAYAQLVLSMRPAVYYRMEPPKQAKDRFQLFDSAPGAHHGVIHFPENFFDKTPYTAGRFGHSIRLRGPMVKDYVVVPDYPKATDDRLTVSVWAMVLGRASLATLAANRFVVPGESHSFGQFILYLHPDNQGGDLAARMTQRNGEDVWIREGRTEMFPLGTWQHVALVIDKTTMRLYRNGREVASAHCNGILQDLPRNYLTVGVKGLPEDLNQEHPGYWPGFIDELVIFNRALPVEDVQRLYHGKQIESKKNNPQQNIPEHN